MFNMEKVFSAIPTPFLDDKIDFQSLENVIEYNIKHSITRIVLEAYNDEWSALVHNGMKKIIEFSFKRTQ